MTLLGDRLTPTPEIDALILAEIDAKRILLDMGYIHGEDDNVCGTTHCRAGSAIVLHPMGLELERVFGWRLAASVIYLAARRGTTLDGQVPDFNASDEDALADMRACAGVVP